MLPLEIWQIVVESWLLLGIDWNGRTWSNLLDFMVFLNKNHTLTNWGFSKMKWLQNNWFPKQNIEYFDICSDQINWMILGSSPAAKQGRNGQPQPLTSWNCRSPRSRSDLVECRGCSVPLLIGWMELMLYIVGQALMAKKYPSTKPMLS